MQNSSNTKETVKAKPIEVGDKPGETQELIDKISHTGVADSEAAAEATGAPGRTHSKTPRPQFPCRLSLATAKLSNA